MGVLKTAIFRSENLFSPHFKKNLKLPTLSRVCQFSIFQNLEKTRNSSQKISVFNTPIIETRHKTSSLRSDNYPQVTFE